jgi:hypothetical protein
MFTYTIQLDIAPENLAEALMQTAHQINLGCGSGGLELMDGTVLVRNDWGVAHITVEDIEE